MFISWGLDLYDCISHLSFPLIKLHCIDFINAAETHTTPAFVRYDVAYGLLLPYRMVKVQSLKASRSLELMPFSSFYALPLPTTS